MSGFQVWSNLSTEPMIGNEYKHFNLLIWNRRSLLRRKVDVPSHNYFLWDNYPTAPSTDLPIWRVLEDLVDIEESMNNSLCTFDIFLSISLISLAEYDPLAVFTNYPDVFGCSSSSLDAINIEAAPTNWKSDFCRLYSFSKYLSNRLTEIKNV